MLLMDTCILFNIILENGNFLRHHHTLPICICIALSGAVVAVGDNNVGYLFVFPSIQKVLICILYVCYVSVT